MKSNISKKINKAVYLLSLLSCIVIVSSIILIGLVEENHNNTDNIINQAKNTWSRDTRAYLKNLQNQLEYVISQGEVNPYNDNEIETWITKNADILYVNDNAPYDFRVVSLGYSICDKSMDIEVLLNNADLDNKEINELFKTKFQTILKGIEEKDNMTILKEIDSVSKEMSMNNGIKYETARDILIRSLLNKDTIILSTKDDSVIYSISDKMSYVSNNLDGEEIWTESIIIPEGVLGFDNQPQYKNNKENESYKKVSIIVSTKANSILEPYNKYINTNDKIVTISLCLLALITLSSIVIIVISFNNILKLNRLGGDNNAIENNRDTIDNINS